MLRSQIAVPVVLALLIALPLAAQDHIAKLERFGVEQGLSHRQVNSICKDQRGFLWIGTPFGLNRFDGHSFRWYTKSIDGLPFDDIQTIHLDSEGWLWVFKTNYTDLFFYKPETGEIKTRESRFGETQIPIDQGNFHDVITSSFSDDLLFTFNQTPDFYIWKQKEGFQKIEVKDCTNFNAIKFATDSSVWGTNRVGSQSDTLWEVGLNGKILHQFPGKTGPVLGPDKSVFVSHERNVQRYYRIEGSGQAVQLPGLIPDIPGVTYWPEDGGIILNSSGQIFYHLDGALLYDLGGKNNRPRCSFTDFKGTIWLGGDFGLYLLTIKPDKFQQVFTQKHTDATSFGKAVRGIAVMGDRVFTNIEEDGFWEFDRNTLQTRLIARHAREDGKIGFQAYYGMFADPLTGDVYSGAGEALLRYTPASGAIKTWSLPWQKQIWAIGRVSAPGQQPGMLLLGGGGFRIQQGLFLLDESNDSIKPFHDYNGYDELKNATIQTIKMDRSGQVWLCASTGFYKFDLAKGITDRYWSQGKGPHFLPVDNVQHFHEDADGTFWIGSAYEGLLHWNTQNGICIKFTRENGFTNNNIYAVYEDAMGHLWLPSDYGLMQFNKKSGHVRAWLTGDGIPHNEFNRLAHAQAPDGQLFLGGLNGITLFYPDNFYEKPSDAEIPLEISGCTVFNSAKNKLLDKLTDVWATNTLKLLPEDANFNLTFALLEFEQPAQILYAWKIEKEADDWNYQKENQISMGRLPYGTYTLRIRGQAANGQWSKQEKAISIEVVRPFYATWWFWLLLLAGAVLGIRSFVRWRTRAHEAENLRLEQEVNRQTATIRQQSEILQRLDNAKSRFFVNISHELRTPLTLLLGPIGSVLNRKKQDKHDLPMLKLAQTQGKQMLQMVNQILDLSKLESGKLELNETQVLLYPLLRRIVAAFESHAEREGIRIITEYQIKNNLRLELDGPKLETILNNLLSNALKFTSRDGTISVKAENRQHAIRISVQDTGRGIHPADLPRIFDRFYQSGQPDAPVEGGAGIGLALCRELAGLMGGKLWVESAGLGRGSQFFFEFPLKEVLGIKETPNMQEQVTIVQTETDLQADAPNLAISGPNELKKTRIMIVEDNGSLRDYLGLILSKYYQVISVENGQAALGIMNDELSMINDEHRQQAIAYPSLIITDIMMPVMDGFQLLERLKSDDRYRHIPVIMLTARAGLEDKLQALRIGVDDYLTKPFEEEELLVRVENLLQHQQHRLQAVPSHEGEAPTLHLSQADADWLAKLENYALAQLENTNFSVTDLAQAAFLSDRQLQRRLREITGFGPQQYITELRLQKARELLDRGAYRTVAEVAYHSGFCNAKSFSRTYRERFGRLPSAYF